MAHLPARAGGRRARRGGLGPRARDERGPAPDARRPGALHDKLTGAPLRIGIDATLLRPDRLTGVERYALALLRAMVPLAAPGEVVVFVRPDAPPELAALPLEQVRAPFANRVAVDQLWLPLAAARAGVDLLHTLAFPTPVAWRGRAALTVHDATPWLHPEATSRGMRLYYRPLYPQALARAAVIFTVSEASRADLVRAVGLAPERIVVTPDGVEPRFFEAAAARDGAQPYLLAVGTLEPRKNLAVLVEALRLLRRGGRDLRLVLAGRRGWRADLALGDLAAHVDLLGPVPDAALPALYAGAACLVLPSLYEGFGLALAEAMAAGTPAVSSDVPALRELGGATVRYAPARDPAAFAREIAAVLDDPAAARARAGAARERARGFRWDACARATLDGYRAALADLPARASRRRPARPGPSAA